MSAEPRRWTCDIPPDCRQSNRWLVIGVVPESDDLRGLGRRTAGTCDGGSERGEGEQGGAGVHGSDVGHFIVGEEKRKMSRFCAIRSGRTDLGMAAMLRSVSQRS